MNNSHRQCQRLPAPRCGRTGLYGRPSRWLCPATSAASLATRAAPAKDASAPPDTATCLVEDTSIHNWNTPLPPGSVVALGKFDALHRGHRALALAAASLAAAGPLPSPSQGHTQDGIVQPRGEASCSGQLQAPPYSVGSSGSGGGTAGSGTAGGPVLLSFSGMAEVLGWPVRLPLVAPEDRTRVLASWEELCEGSAAAAGEPAGNGACGDSGSGPGSSGMHAGAGSNGSSSGNGEGGRAGGPGRWAPRLRTIPFHLIRGMSPEEFVRALAHDLRAAGVVAGRNYRFGFKAAGDAAALQSLGARYGLRVAIVDLLMDGCEGLQQRQGAAREGAGPGAPGAAAVAGSAAVGAAVGGNGAAADAAAAPAAACSRVSSSRIRELLQQGHVESVEQLLGRKYRLMCCGRAELAAGAGAGAGVRSGVERSEGAGGQSVPSATRPEDSNGIGSGTAGSSRSISSSSATVAGTVGGCALRLPASSYRNQAPANGQYRALVQVLPADTDLAVLGSNGSNVATLPYGPACVNVSLGEEGIQVELDSDMAGQLLTRGQEVAMLVDFDACG